jgi:hypothetical protein
MMGTEAESEEATRARDDKQSKQALVLTPATGFYNQTFPQTFLSWPYHYIMYIGRTPGVPIHFILDLAPGAQGTR